MSTDLEQTLTEKCKLLLLQLVRYGKGAAPEHYRKFQSAAAQIESIDPVTLATAIMPDIYTWANNLEKKTPNLSRHLNFRGEWGTLLKAVEVIDELNKADPQIKPPANYSAFMTRVKAQQKLRDDMDRRDLASHDRSGGWGRDDD